MSAAVAVGQGVRSFVRFFRDVMGEDAYRKYADFHAASGCASPLMSEKEFWRDKMDRQDANPQGRCC
ncbi:YbdD/YjiX family protein [Arthrobacter sp. zg-Y1143]|uniref:YbdD/YjiX family protein n=1 Tax=Arthrobacter sp. zg-Y1143 TaxID=3049065 RepID=UPI0024C3C1B3|nr:YbdD/YjiX family protein [Arthrobacter sp. zg-Y1143]MDK1328753.1 YbdD/YjiX family protein [Arthrobacter sp. zg-Y1143]